LEQIESTFKTAKDVYEQICFIQNIRYKLHELSPLKDQPVDLIHWVPIEMVEPNDYNPNSVAPVELKLLYTSIWADGYTQPSVTIWDPERGKFIIIDGFHRYYTCKMNKDVRERNHGMLPIVVLQKDLAERMAATVRHNRARGKHSIQGMSNLVFGMLNEGKSDADICNELGMEPEELLKLKHISGFSKLFQDTAYSKSWKSKNQILIEKKLKDQQKETM
jgi:hypothetical protein